MNRRQDQETTLGTRPSPRARLLLLLLAAALGAASALAAPQAAEPLPAAEDETFFESIDVNVVNVEVVVTDRSGKRVTGLGREDFELREDGKPVAITNFYAVADPAAAVPEAAAPAPEAAAPATTLELPDDQRLYLAVFIDNRSMMPGTRSRLLRSLQETLRSRLGAQDRVLLVTYDGTVDVHRLPDARPETVAATLDRIAKSPARGTELLVDRRRLIQEISQGGVPPEPGGGPERPSSADLEAAKIYAGVKLYAQTRHGENERALRALGQVVDSLAGLPGRKALLYVTGGLSLRPGEAVYRAWADKYERFRFEIGASELDIAQFDATPLLNRLAERANTNRVTFYALGSAEGISSLNAESEGGSWSRELERTESLNYSQPLQVLAGATGGLAAFDPVSADSFLARMSDDLGSYYSLGYTPQRRPDGKRHKLAVQVRRAGLTARYREAHRDRVAEERMASQTLSALLFGETDNPLEAALEFEAERPGAKKGEIEVSILVKVPMAKLVLLPQEHVHEGRLRVFVGARDIEGRVSDVTTVEAPIRVPNENLLTALGQVVACRVTLVLRAGEHVVAASIWDDLGKADSTVVARYDAGGTTAAAAAPGAR